MGGLRADHRRDAGRGHLDPATAEVRTRARDGHDDAAATAAQSVCRFAAAVLGLTIS